MLIGRRSLECISAGMVLMGTIAKLLTVLDISVFWAILGALAAANLPKFVYVNISQHAVGGLLLFRW